MSTIKKNEIYDSLNGFLQTKGVQLSQGPYSNVVRKACGFITDAVNLAHDGVERTRDRVDSKLDEFRQVIHDATAPKAKPAARKPRARKKAAGQKSVKRKAIKKVANKRKVTRRSTGATARRKTARL